MVWEEIDGWIQELSPLTLPAIDWPDETGKELLGRIVADVRDLLNLHDELVIETDTSIAEEILTLAKQRIEECAGLIFKGVPMLVEGNILDSWE